MKMTDPVLGVDGKPFMHSPDKQWTIGSSFSEAALYQEQGDKLTAKDHILRFDLAKKCLGDDAKFTTDEIVLLKSQISKCFPTRMAAPMLNLLPE